MRVNDRKNRSIDIDIDDEGNIVASHGHEIVGTFEFKVDDEDPTQSPELVHMDIDKPYQDCGIGTKMMRFAVEHYRYFILPKPTGYGSENYLTEEGARLVNSCFNNGILPENFKEQYIDKHE